MAKEIYVVEDIREVLYPDGDRSAEWGPDTLEEIARLVDGVEASVAFAVEPSTTLRKAGYEPVLMWRRANTLCTEGEALANIAIAKAIEEIKS